MAKRRQAEQHAEIALARVEEERYVFETGVPVKFPFIRNTAKSPYFGDRFQQDIEPAGRYMLFRSRAVKPQDGWEAGVVTFKSPLVLLLNTDPDGPYYNETSWKARLQRIYGHAGKKLTRALLADGYDGIVTVTCPRQRGIECETREIVDLAVIGQPVLNPDDKRWRYLVAGR